MHVFGPWTFDGEGWSCKDVCGGDELCDNGLTAALNTELEHSNMYEINLYTQRPRTDVAELRLQSLNPITWSGRIVIDEFENSHEISECVANLIEECIGAEPGSGGRFFARALDLGVAPKEIMEGYYDEFGGTLELEATDGSRVQVVLKDVLNIDELEWSHS